MANVNFEIIKHLHRFSSEERNLWHKELNLVSWNGKMPKYDIRDWVDEDHPGRGVTLTEAEFRELIETAEELLY